MHLAPGPGHHFAAAALLAAALIAAGGEAFWISVVRRRGYPWRDAATSLAVALLQRVGSLAASLALIPIFALAWQHRIGTLVLPPALSAATAFLAVEFAYYWGHRLGHAVPWAWATHSVHHSSETMTLPAAVRLGATEAVSGNWLLYLPLIWIGFAPGVVAALLAGNLAYQFFLHTELIGFLGPLEGVLNTPSAHRVHHAVNACYRDGNFGGVLLVFDRLFRTYVAERTGEAAAYGLRGERRGRNPLRVLFGGWISLFAGLRSCGGGRAAITFALGLRRTRSA